ncbi:MAG: HAD hydrolase-like protein [Rhizobiales bacterium]|nr:HAD hydrolase-like protein [Hyphomicrobiales bacterium]
MTAARKRLRPCRARWAVGGDGKMRHLTFAFDLDGTLVDTAPDLARATNHALEQAGLSPVELEVILPSVSLGAAAMIETAMRHLGREPKPEEAGALLDAFLRYYEANIAVDSRPYPGAAIVLERLVDLGARVTICTNKREHLSRKLLHALDLARHCHAIVGRDTLPICKPDPGHLIGAIILADGNPNRAIMIGDSDVDVRTAQKAGIPVIGVSFGYSPEPIASYGPDAVIAGYGELEGAVQTLAARL